MLGSIAVSKFFDVLSVFPKLFILGIIISSSNCFQRDEFFLRSKRGPIRCVFKLAMPVEF